MTRTLSMCALLFSLPTWGVALRYPQADLHGFPSMSDQTGKLIADGELTQKLEGTRLVVHAVWRFKDGRVAIEDDRLRLKPELAQESFRWVERRGKTHLRRLEGDFGTREASGTQL